MYTDDAKKLEQVIAENFKLQTEVGKTADQKSELMAYRRARAKGRTFECLACEGEGKIHDGMVAGYDVKNMEVTANYSYERCADCEGEGEFEFSSLDVDGLCELIKDSGAPNALNYEKIEAEKAVEVIRQVFEAYEKFTEIVKPLTKPVEPSQAIKEEIFKKHGTGEIFG